MSDLYKQDYYTWTKEQAALLRDGDITRADIEHIAEELDDMGNSKQDQFTSRLGILLAHLLKWNYQPERRGRSWMATIREQRRRLERLLHKNPGLMGELRETFADAYGDALQIAVRETDLPETTFPAASPWTFEQAMSDEPA